MGVPPALDFRKLRESLTSKPGKQKDKPSEGEERSILPPKTCWTFDDFIENANKTLDALHSCVNVRKSYMKRWGSDYADQGDWADIRLFGPYLPYENEGAYDCNQAEVYGELPFFGSVALPRGTSEEDKKYGTMFVLFRRMDALPPGYVPTGPGYPYLVNFISVFNDGPFKVHWCCTIEKDGTIHATKWMKTTWQRVGYYKSVKRTSLQLFDPVGDWRRAQGHEVKSECASADFAAWAISVAQRIDNNVNARVSDHRGVVNITIPLEEAKSVFSKRIKVKTPSGRTKPILHWVKAHRRVNGSNVKTHWRGLREFTIDGMDVQIRMPGEPMRDFYHMFESGAGWFSKLAAGLQSVKRTNPATGETVEFCDAGESRYKGIYYTGDEKRVMQ